MTEKKTKKEKLKAMLTKRNLVIGIFGVLFVAQYVQMQSMFGTFSFLQGRDTSLITEIGQVKQAYVDFSTDLSEVRNFLRLPAKNYSGFDEPEDVESFGKNKDEVQLALFKYVDALSADRNRIEKINKGTEYINGLSESELFTTFLEKKELSISKVSDTESSTSLEIIQDDEKLMTVSLNKDEETLNLMSILGKDEISYSHKSEFENTLKSSIDKNISTIKDAKVWVSAKATDLTQLLVSAHISKLLAELDIVIERKSNEESLQVAYSISNKSGDIIGEIILDAVASEILLVDAIDSSRSLKVNEILVAEIKFTELEEALTPFLKNLDTKTFLEKKFDDAVAGVENTVSDKGFQLLMKEALMSISDVAREDELRFYYDIFYLDGSLISSIAIEKATGVITVVDENGANSQNLLLFDPEYKKKTLEIPENVPNYGSELVSTSDSLNILIAGKHGSLIDTMIVVHIDENRRDIRMISVPRDLFYNGRKINSYAFFYGMPELVGELSKISGYEIDKYLLIDMYAFIDVIDILGGIDITLERAVIDPTYRTVDDGVEGTLHYEPGDYHLSGVQALRLARTRHTSSDFARAERQQLILESIQEKARSFGFGDADTIYEIAKTVLAKTETNVDIDEAIAYYFRYQKFDIISNHVISSGNILTVPPYITTENCNLMIAEAEAAGQANPGCSDENHAYTLMPRDNNWNLIKWFFRDKFEGII